MLELQITQQFTFKGKECLLFTTGPIPDISLLKQLAKGEYVLYAEGHNGVCITSVSIILYLYLPPKLYLIGRFWDFFSLFSHILGISLSLGDVSCKKSQLNIIDNGVRQTYQCIARENRERHLSNIVSSYYAHCSSSYHPFSGF